MTDTPVIDVAQPPTVYLRFERSVSPEQYGKRSASVSYPVVLTGDPAKDAVAIDTATSLIHQVVLDGVGIGYEVKDGKVVERAQEPVVRTQTPHTPTANIGDAGNVEPPSGFDVARWGDPTEVRACPLKADHATFNNRADKARDFNAALAKGDIAQAEKIEKRPDFKCKNYRAQDGGCKGVVWHNETT